MLPALLRRYPFIKVEQVGREIRDFSLLLFSLLHEFISKMLCSGPSLEISN